MCHKVKYDKRGAQTALNNCRAYKTKRRKEKRIYYCGECNGWHLTSMEEEDFYTEGIIIKIVHKERWEKLIICT